MSSLYKVHLSIKVTRCGDVDPVMVVLKNVFIVSIISTISGDS